MRISNILFFLILLSFYSCGEDDGLPDSIIIHTLRVANLSPLTPNGVVWDLLDLPDIEVFVNSKIEFQQDEFDVSEDIIISNKLKICYGESIHIRVMEVDAVFADQVMIDAKWDTDFPLTETSITLLNSGGTIFIDEYELVY